MLRLNPAAAPLDALPSEISLDPPETSWLLESRLAFRRQRAGVSHTPNFWDMVSWRRHGVAPRPGSGKRAFLHPFHRGGAQPEVTVEEPVFHPRMSPEVTAEEPIRKAKPTTEEPVRRIPPTIMRPGARSGEWTWQTWAEHSTRDMAANARATEMVGLGLVGGLIGLALAMAPMFTPKADLFAPWYPFNLVAGPLLGVTTAYLLVWKRWTLR